MPRQINRCGEGLLSQATLGETLTSLCDWRRIRQILAHWLEWGVGSVLLG